MSRAPLLRFILVTILALAGVEPLSARDNMSLPRGSWMVAGYASPDSVESRLSALPLHDVEGLWCFPGSGAMVAVERTADPAVALAGIDTYLIVVVRAADRSVRPGTVMGALRRGASRNAFEAQLYTSTARGGVLKNPRTVDVALVDDNAYMQFKPRKSRWQFNPWALLPYMFRRLVRPNGDSREPSVGCYRVWPEPAVPINPRYL